MYNITINEKLFNLDKSRLFTKLIWQLVSIIKAYTLKIVMINILKLGGP